MRNGAGIHVRDRNNDTPLMCAINADQRATIKGTLLVKLWYVVIIKGKVEPLVITTLLILGQFYKICTYLGDFSSNFPDFGTFYYLAKKVWI